MSHIFLLSPLTSLSKGSKTSTGSIEDMGDPSEEELDPKSVVVDDPMIGEKIVTLDEHGPGAIQPQNIPAPKDISAIERAKHFASDTYLMIPGARYVYLEHTHMYLIIMAMNSI